MNLYKASGLTGLFTGQFNTEDNGTFTGVIKSIGGSTSCSSHIIYTVTIIILFVLLLFLTGGRPVDISIITHARGAQSKS